MENDIENVYWPKYDEVFPDRYQVRSYFDGFKDRMVTKGLDILDIGGGVRGTLSTTQAKDNNVWMDDPFLNTVPEGYKPKDFNPLSIRQYDLIIIRSSFNYILPLDIIDLPKLLKPDGKIIFNTFIEPSEIFRPYFKNKKFTGYEKTIYEPTANNLMGYIWHYLIPEKGKIIRHKFFYYSNEFIRSLFKGMVIQRKIDKNTAIYVIQHSFQVIKI